MIRWDLDHGDGGRQRFAAPGADRVLEGSSQGFWLLGKTAFYAWDGRALRRAEPPLDFEDAWRGSSGEVWLVGTARAASGKTSGDDPEGAVFRVATQERQVP